MIHVIGEVEILIVMWSYYITLNLIFSCLSSAHICLMSAMIFYLKSFVSVPSKVKVELRMA